MQVTSDNTLVFFAPGVIISYGQAIDATWHKHSLWQLCLPIGAALLDDQPIDSAVLIEPNIRHKLVLPRGWVILIEPESELAHAICHAYHNGLRDLTASESEADLSSLQRLFSAWPELTALLTHNPHKLTDSRISGLIKRLDTCFDATCLKPQQWRAAEVAADLALSESRFLHLFKSELGIAWRPYLLWRRLICALISIKAGKSQTEAAYLAGFSDSAHLSRTIKQTFGMTGRDLVKSFTFD